MPCERVGHGGASAVERGNTLASFDAACAIGVDVIEFDVRAWRGELVLAHTLLEARCRKVPRLEEALGHLSRPAFSGVGLHLDVKSAGCEEAVLAALRRARLLERAVVCSQVPAVIDRFKQLDPAISVGVSLGGRLARVPHRWGDWRRAALAGLASGRWNMLMIQHRLVDPALVGAVAERESRLYAWTVNDRSSIERLREMGVHGITTADPRLFG